MAELQKGSPGVGTVLLALGLAVAILTVCSTLKGGQDACEVSGGQPRGVECKQVEEK